MGGFDGTSNCLAGKLFHIPVQGTHAHSYITSFSSFSDLTLKMLTPKNGGTEQDLLQLSSEWRQKISKIFKVKNNKCIFIDFSNI